MEPDYPKKDLFLWVEGTEELAAIGWGITATGTSFGVKVLMLWECDGDHWPSLGIWASGYDSVEEFCRSLWD